MKSSLPEVDKPYRKSDNSHRKWSYYVNGEGGGGVGNVVESRVDTTRYFQKSTRLFWLKTLLEIKEMKQEAMQCIPRSVNLCRQMTRFK